MSQILLLLDHQGNRHRLSQWLTQHYQVTSPSTAEQVQWLTEKSCDLIICDGTALRRLQGPLQTKRDETDPVFLPCLLVTPQSTQSQGELPPQLWAYIDEQITIPCSQPKLRSRIEILLRARRSSLALQTANEELQAANALKSQFVSIVSHEFRNSLSFISGITQVLEKKVEAQSSEKIQTLFDRLHKGIEKAENLTADLLILGRTGTGRLQFNPVPLNLEEYCRFMIETYHASTERDIHLSIQGNCTRVLMDETLLDHILTNLVSNALKYSPQESSVQLRLNAQGDRIEIQVQDAGIGIPLADQAQLFQSFHRASNVGKIVGTGLGLVIVQQCVTLHQGQISLRSQTGEGTTFKIILPSGG